MPRRKEGPPFQTNDVLEASNQKGGTPTTRLMLSCHIIYPTPEVYVPALLLALFHALGVYVNYLFLRAGQWPHVC